MLVVLRGGRDRQAVLNYLEEAALRPIDEDACQLRGGDVNQSHTPSTTGNAPMIAPRHASD